MGWVFCNGLVTDLVTVRQRFSNGSETVSNLLGNGSSKCWQGFDVVFFCNGLSKWFDNSLATVCLAAIFLSAGGSNLERSGRADSSEEGGFALCTVRSVAYP